MSRVWAEPPEARAYTPNLAHRRPAVVLDAALPRIEQIVVVVLASPGRWFVVDEFRGSTRQPSSIRLGLWRRGFEVVQRRHDNSPDIVQVWARWTHPVPDRLP